MKKCKDCGEPRGHENPLISRCKKCQYAKQEKKHKEIKPISEKRKIRIKENGEAKMFQEIWNEREHKCTNCNIYIPEPKTWTFSHIKSKGSRPDLRMEKTNIEILCFKCHFKADHGLNYKGNLI